MFLPVGAFAGSYEPEAIAFFARMTSTNSVLRDNLNTLIKGLKDDSLWSLIEVLNVVQLLEADSLLNIKENANNTTAINVPTFTADQGWLCATTGPKYLSCGLIPNAATILQPDDCSGFVYRRTVTHTLGGPYIFGDIDDASLSPVGLFRMLQLSGLYQFSLEDYNPTVSKSTIGGFIGLSRTDSSTVIHIDDGSTATYTQLSGYQLPSVATKIGFLLDDEVNSWVFGAGMTSTQMLQLRGHINTYLTERGAT